MAGQIKHIIDRIIEQRAHGNQTIATTTVTKMIIRGIDPDKFSAQSPDDPEVVTRVKVIAAEMGVYL
jgi:hypothetical protein